MLSLHGGIKFLKFNLQWSLQTKTFNSARIFIDSLEDYANQEIATIDARNPNDSSISSFS